jgi:hypothetical protein
MSDLLCKEKQAALLCILTSNIMKEGNSLLGIKQNPQELQIGNWIGIDR